MYDIIYDFLINNVFNGTSLTYSFELFGQSTSMNVWLSHSVTLIVMAIFIWSLIMFCKFLFRVVGGLFLLK